MLSKARETSNEMTAILVAPLHLSIACMILCSMLMRASVVLLPRQNPYWQVGVDRARDLLEQKVLGQFADAAGD
jgi:hypothetical protein